MSKLQEAAAAMKKLELEAMEERNAAQLKRECKYLMQDRPLDLAEAQLTAGAIKHHQDYCERWEWNAE